MPNVTTTTRIAWGEGVRILRKIHNLTQTDLAAKVGTTQAKISDLERGSRTLPDRYRVRIAAAFKVLPHELFPYEDDGR